MKKIGLITLTGNDNFGNKLQHYAMQTILSCFCEVKSIDKYNSALNRGILEIKLKNIYKLLIKDKAFSSWSSLRRHLNFIKFDKKINHYKKQITKKTNFENLNLAFDYFVCGSDQVWNPRLDPDIYYYMLGFATKEKKIAIAPSISIDLLNKKEEQLFQNLLLNFENISCREEQGADLLRKITGKKVVSLIDPTLMLSSEEWDKVSKKPKFHNEEKKYVLLYFLGELSYKYIELINKISKTHNLEVINILDKKSRYYSCGPSEFIYMIKNCSLMLTDSFHGSVFSYIYNKPFRIFYRQGGCGYMNSRLTNLMDKLHLDSSIYLKDTDPIEDILEVHYDKTFLIKEQEKFKKYLEGIFNI